MLTRMSHRQERERETATVDGEDMKKNNLMAINSMDIKLKQFIATYMFD